MSSIIQFKNCRILVGGELKEEDLYVKSGKIINYQRIFYSDGRSPDVVVDCQGQIIAPGFIDIQFNGGYGYDFSHNVDTIEEAVEAVSKRLLATGVTAYCPTIVTSTPEVYKSTLQKVKPTVGGKHGASVLGLHLEGPFINLNKRGAHNPQHIRALENDVSDIQEVYGNDLSNVAIVTLAPELDTTGKVTKCLTHRGVAVSMGHSEAGLIDGETAANNGATLITHLFNAMLPFHHRDPGLVGLLTSKAIKHPVYYGLIADGCHTHPATLRIAYRTNFDSLILVTDAMSAMGLESGHHFIGDMEVEIKDNRAFIAGTSTLCGSIATMEFCVKQFKKGTRCSTAEALQAASLHPAQALRLDGSKGSLEVGCDADLVQLDDDLNVLSTWIAGECVWKKSADMFRQTNLSL